MARGVCRRGKTEVHTILFFGGLVTYTPLNPKLYTLDPVGVSDLLLGSVLEGSCSVGYYISRVPYFRELPVSHGRKTGRAAFVFRRLA